MVDSPIHLKFKGYYGFQHVKSCIMSYMEQYLPPADFDFMEVAVFEAINNAIRHGNQLKNAWVMVKTNFTRGRRRNRLTIRIRDQGPGFCVSGTLAKLSHSLNFENTEQNEAGRGLLIMMAAADFIVFNMAGNEVMLVKFVGEPQTVADGSSGGGFLQ